VIYEIDLPAVLDYKTSTLNANGATPGAIRREVGIDLRHDWPPALRSAGFDPAQPTAWLAEGLLPYLQANDQEALFGHVHELTAPGSQVAVEVAIKPSGLLVHEQPPGAQQKSPTLRAASTSAQPGEDETFDPSRLWYVDEDGPIDCATWFDSHGWTTQSLDSRQEQLRLGRHKPTDHDQPRPLLMSFITAARVGEEHEQTGSEAAGNF
jgi:methyltransferase (TIGR00027 family)